MLSSVLFVPAVWIVAARRGHRVALAAVSVVLVTCVVLSFLVARHYTTEVVAKRDMRTASGLFGRANLWADGYRMFSGNSLIGVGPGGFQEKSFFGSDPDGRWVHNEFLQTAAETGRHRGERNVGLREKTRECAALACSSAQHGSYRIGFVHS